MRPIRNLNSITTSATATPPPLMAVQPRSPWHSPVPYLFGGLAAMLGLIAFALLILACSYWRLSGRLDDNEGGGDRQRDLENGKDGSGGGGGGMLGKVYEEKILVIMAGDQKPTFLATPVSGKGSCFEDKNFKIDENSEKQKTENEEKIKEDDDNNQNEENEQTRQEQN